MAVSGCLTARPNQGDERVAKLRLGMTKEEVQAELGPSPLMGAFDLPRDYQLFLGDVAPYDLLRFVPEGAETWTYAHWASSNTRQGITLFFSPENRLIGWTKDHSDFSRNKYEHEKLTSQLRYEMSERQVLERLGPPSYMTKKPEQRSRELYADHYWFNNPGRSGFRSEMWTYVYPVPNGGERKVYLLWGRTQLLGWGYDRAHEEAERYVREQGRK
jgi:hypothetical protein